MDVSLSSTLRGFHSVDLVVVVHVFVFVLFQIEERNEASVVDCSENETGKWTPSYIDNGAAKGEVHDRVCLVDVPDFDGEVCGAGDEGVRVVVVPVDVVDGQFVAAVGLEVGAGVRLGALVDGAFLSSDQEFTVIVLGAEVEAECCGLLGNGRLVILSALVAWHILAVQL